MVKIAQTAKKLTERFLKIQKHIIVNNILKKQNKFFYKKV